MKSNYTIVLAALLGGLTLAAYGQSMPVYNSGSTGADGAFNPVLTGTNLTGVPAGCTWYASGPITYINVPLNPSGVYNFTTITIPANYRVRFLPNANNTPVVWLATGDITIGGEISVGAADTQAAIGSAPNLETIPGPGGFAGGYTGPGGGPYGGIWDGGHVYGEGGNAGATPLSLPLAGGSGGGKTPSGNGSGGGGVIYLASSTKIIFSPDCGDTPNGIIVDAGPGYYLGPLNGWARFRGMGGFGAAGLFANEIVGPVRSHPVDRHLATWFRTMDRILVVANKHDSATVGQRAYPGTLSGVSLAATPSAFINSIGGVQIPQNPGTTIYAVPQAGTNAVQILTANLPLGIVFAVGTTLLDPTSGGMVGSTTNVNFPATTAWTNANWGTTTGDVVIGGGQVSLITAVATAPVLIALAPTYDGSPVTEFQLAVDSRGKLTRQFVTAKGAILSYEAAMSLAMQQGKWQFLLHPLAS